VTSTAIASTLRPPAHDAPLFHVGRTFVHPAFDVLVIGGLLTLPIALWTALAGRSASAFIGMTFPVVALVCNQTHFAASTVRLYTKPETQADLPFLTMAFPLVTMAVTTAFVLFADRIGNHFYLLYLTWSPYHYAAQTFGLATMYCYRSGCRLDRHEWWAMRIACVVPFLQAFVAAAPIGSGLGWLVPYSTLVSDPRIFAVMTTSFTTLNWASFVLPVTVFGWITYRSRFDATVRTGADTARPGMPLVSLVLMLSNAVWWVLFPFWDALIWATVLHGLQYLGIMAIFYSDDALRRDSNRHGRTYHVVALLLMCTALGYALFECWPRAYMLAGFGQVESTLMVLAAINIHHFIVDRYIWRIRKDHNYATVVA
jgi:hypothetical protein